MLNNIAFNLGIGSGVDTAALVTSLADASRVPKIARLNARQADIEAQVSTLARARAALADFAQGLANFSTGGGLAPTIQNSNPDRIGVAITGTLPTTLPSSEIEIVQLARAQTLSSNAVVDASAAIGQGALTLSIAGADHTISIGPENDSLTGLAEAINASGSGVQASIVSDVQGSRLVLKGPSGAANGFTLTVDAGSDPGLNAFTFNGSSGSLTQTQSALNAQLLVDGVAVETASNTVDSILPGVRLSLLEAAPGETISVAFSRTPDALRQAVSDFVDIFNSVRSEFAAAGSANGRNPALNAIDRQLAAMLSEAVTGDPSVNSLSDIGITTNRDGSVSLDSTRFEAALSANPQAIERMFVPQGNDVGLPGRIAEINALADGNDSRLDALRQRLEDQIEQIDIDRDKVELREANYRNRLQEQFGAMDARISALRATQSYLEQQIAIWTNNN